MCEIKDIAAMKLSAIVDSGSRLKDFVDIACLSTKFSLETMLVAYEEKYKAMNAISPLKAIPIMTIYERAYISFAWWVI